MSDDLVFREVDGELLQEKLWNFWRLYGVYAILVAVLVVIGFSAYGILSWRAETRANQSGTNFETALRLIDEGRSEQAFAALETLKKDGSDDYPVLARFVEAGLKARNGQYSDAMTAYDLLSHDVDDESLRALALLESGRLSLLLAETEPSFWDRPVSEVVSRRLAPIMNDASPWYHAARELVALAAYHDDDIVTAGAMFRRIATDSDISPGMRLRSEVMLAVIVPREMDMMIDKIQ